MNKYQAAFKSISDNQYQYGSDEDWELMEKLVDKETPKKPVIDLDEDGEPYLPRGVKLCPVCDEYVHKKYNDYYCGNCGQKLDWSEE